MPLLSQNCLFIHIPKCGGTSLEVGCGLARDYPTLGLAPTFLAPNYDALFGGDLQHLSAAEIAENYGGLANRQGMRQFSILRHPVDRLVSHFVWRHYRFQQPQITTSQLVSHFEAFFEESLISFADGNILFDYPQAGMKYIEGVEGSVHLNDINRHLVPQVAFLYEGGNLLVNELFDFEKLDDVFKMLRESFGVECQRQHVMSGGASKQVRDGLSLAIKDKICDLYKHDINLLDEVQSSAGRVTQGANLPFYPNVQNAVTARPVPKIIWMYWAQGWDNAPDLVKRCLQNWQLQNKNWKFNLLDDTNISDFSDVALRYQGINLPVQAFSDVLRINLLAQYGGVWADATTWCVRPLDQWIEKMVDQLDFFAYSKPAASRPISSWFLIAPLHSKIAETYRDAVDQFWLDTPTADDTSIVLSSDPCSINYFWFHHLFDKLLQNDADFAKTWEAMPQLSADGPHLLQHAGLLSEPTDEAIFSIRNRLTNIYKLTHRIEIPRNIEETLLNYLYSSAY